ncbi:unnamed protein product [Hymenolepis diminuta]|uniref:Uncharacterized protein n=1 Tax=Hymenolepis diminuta TaxID=6216 RepID=A0A564Y5H1_HYMDI|nr:unnamed protein product [Hymenolepis diminuta]
MFWCASLPSNSYKALFVLHSVVTRASVIVPYASSSSSLFLSMLPSLSLSHTFQTRCGFLEYIFGLIKSWYSALQLFLALTQTTTNW